MICGCEVAQLRASFAELSPPMNRPHLFLWFVLSAPITLLVASCLDDAMPSPMDASMDGTGDASECPSGLNVVYGTGTDAADCLVGGAGDDTLGALSPYVPSWDHGMTE